MMVLNNEISRDVIVKNELGLHARSAAQINSLVQNARAKIWIQKGKDRADASSILEILTLACERGTMITVTIENPSDLKILNAIIDLVEHGFGE
jgi:phosphotransferase system HPr (HPr) family protein